MNKKMEYKVRPFENSLFAVHVKDAEDKYDWTNRVYVGSLADCEAWIRLAKEGLL